MKILFF